MKRLISLGAGVQSSALTLMAAEGAFGPIPDGAIFADTGWEPAAVYEHLKWLQSVGLPFPIHIVSAGNLRTDTMNGVNVSGKPFFNAVPWFTLSRGGKRGMAQRQCTKNYKLNPIKQKIRQEIGEQRPKPASAESWIGISMDEAWRMKPSQVKYIINRFPLIEHKLTRRDCLAWIESRDFPKPPKSSCIGCPYHADDQWRALAPAEFADAVAIDKAIRHQGGPNIQRFMHRSLVPLDQVDLSTHAERGQSDLFINECEGMCGL